MLSAGDWAMLGIASISAMLVFIAVAYGWWGQGQ